MSKPQSVLVTGGGSGIGAAIALALADRQCDVLISGRRQYRLDAVAASSSRISTSVGDVTDRSDRSEMAALLGRMPEPRAIVHAAGYFQAGLLDQLTIDDWRRSFETNVQSRWELSRECSDVLDGGRILFIGSDAGTSPRAGAGAYSIAQAASEVLRRALQAEWSDTSVAIGAFKPGLVDTDMVRGFMNLSPQEFPGRSVYEQYVDRGRIASSRDVGRFAAWLLRDVDDHRFVATDWDIRNAEHHPEWTDRPLYPDAP